MDDGGELFALVVFVILVTAIVVSFIRENRKKRRAAVPQAVTVVTAVAARSIPATWRRSVFPACPNCGSGRGIAEHRGCRTQNRDLYIDLATGLLHCIGCRHEAGLEGWKNYCHQCGAVWEGGEIWEGMAAEVGQMGDVAWLRAAGVRRGTPEISFLGWWWCLGCREQFMGNYLRLGSRRGGICMDCHDSARRDLASHPYGTVGYECSWCGYATLERGPRFGVGDAYICRKCIEEISRKRARGGF